MKLLKETSTWLIVVLLTSVAIFWATSLEPGNYLRSLLFAVAVVGYRHGMNATERFR